MGGGLRGRRLVLVVGGLCIEIQIYVSLFVCGIRHIVCFAALALLFQYYAASSRQLICSDLLAKCDIGK